MNTYRRNPDISSYTLNLFVDVSLLFHEHHRPPTLLFYQKLGVVHTYPRTLVVGLVYLSRFARKDPNYLTL